LILNGFILYGVMQGDRIVVAISCSMADLGRFAVAFQLGLVPALVISRVVTGVWLPILSRSQFDQPAYVSQCNRAMRCLAAIALCYAVMFLSLGDMMVTALYGAPFAVSQSLIAWLAIMHAVRILRTFPSVAAMGRADTRSPLVANMFRLLGIIGAVISGQAGWGLEAIVAAGAVGELLALFASVVLLHRTQALPTATAVWSAMGLLLGTGSASYVLHLADFSLAARLGLCLAAGSSLVVLVLRENRIWLSKSQVAHITIHRVHGHARLQHQPTK
jgi:O-antigen/teichoic acid export membrane protein